MIEPKYATLQTLFADRVFRIPHYQRFYSWQKRQRDDLFSDLKNLADHGNDNHHFMATIVCHRTQEIKPVGATEYRVYDIVDGQQRITTLIILLKCIELSLGKSTEEHIELSRIIVKRDGNLVLLQTNNVNEHMFNSFLRDGREPDPKDLSTHADRTLASGIRECRLFVQEWSAERGGPMSLLRLVQNKLGFVVYDTEDSRVVYSIFEVLNSRGLAVDWLDKCKSILMGKAFELSSNQDAAESAIRTLQDIWSKIYKAIAGVGVSGQEILRVTATLHYGPYHGKPKRADDALELLRNDCDNADKPRQISEKIFEVTKRLVDLDNNKFLGPVTRVLQARILAVALQSTQCLTTQELEKALDQWERVAFRIFGLHKKDARTKVGDYIRLASKITTGSDGMDRYSNIMQGLRELGSEFAVDAAVEEGLAHRDCYEDADVCRFVLWRYEEHLARKAGRGATIDPHMRNDVWVLRAADSIEHIFPQNPEPGGAWDGTMRDGDGPVEDPGAHVDRIGNLVLLPMVLNLEVKRQGFKQKKEVYDRHNLRMIREILMTDEGIDRAQWTLREIELREARILEWAKTEWADLGAD